MSVRSALVVAALCTVLTGTPAYAAGMFVLPNGSVLYNSGIDLVGNIDQAYTMSINPFNPGSPNAFLQGAGYLSASNTDSGWLTPAGTGTDAPDAEYEIETSIDLTALDPATLVFDGFWVSDNQGLDIFVNGVSTGQTNSGSHTQSPSAVPASAFSLTPAHGLIAGANTIAFRWGNGAAGGATPQFPDPVHVRIEFTGVTVVPLPPAAILFAPVGFWLLRHRRSSAS